MNTPLTMGGGLLLPSNSALNQHNHNSFISGGGTQHMQMHSSRHYINQPLISHHHHQINHHQTHHQHQHQQQQQQITHHHQVPPRHGPSPHQQQQQHYSHTVHSHQTHQHQHQHQPHSHQLHSPMQQHHAQPTPPPPTPSLTPQSVPSPMPSYTSRMQTPSVERSSPLYHHIPQTELRIIELNKRLEQRPKSRASSSPIPWHGSSEESIWWERFAGDYFDDNSTLTLRVPGNDRPTEYTIGRTLIPRFFKSYFDGGVVDLFIKLNNIKESHRNGLIILDCDQTEITTKNIFKPATENNDRRLKNIDPMTVIVQTVGYLSLEFVSNSYDNLLIKSWRFFTNHCNEYIGRHMYTSNLPNEYLVEPVTRFGLTKSTTSYLKMCMIMQPMQDLMLHHRQTNMDPKSCLKQLLYDRYKFTVEETPQEIPQIRKRKRRAPVNTAPKSTTKRSRSAANNQINGTSPEQKINKLNEQNVISVDAAIDLPQVSQNVLEIEDDPRSHERKLNTDSQPITESSETQCQLSEPQDTVSAAEPTLQQIDSITNVSTYTDPNSSQIESVPDSSQEVPIAGEPSLFEADLNDENEHRIKKVENNQFESPTLNGSTPSTCDSDQPTINNCSQNGHTDLRSSADEDERASTSAEEPSRPVSEEPSEKENISSAINEDKIFTNKVANKVSNGTSKQNRRRSSERKETMREGLMRTSDFVVAMKDIKCEHPALWRITTGNNLLQQFQPKTQNGIVLYENTNQYAGWNPEIRKDYVGVDVKMTQHTRNQITVERLLLNFQKLDDPDAFFDKHFRIYVQILISIALDPKFWESIEDEPEHHDYFLTSRKIVEDTIKRYKLRLSTKLKLNEAALKNFEKYPNLIIDPVDNGKSQTCRACNTNQSTQLVTFGNRSYDLHSFKQVKVTKGDDKNLNNHLCGECLNIVKLYSEVHHLGWKFFNLSREKVERHRSSGKPISEILAECLEDEQWLDKIYAESDSLRLKIENVSSI